MSRVLRTAAAVGAMGVVAAACLRGEPRVLVLPDGASGGVSWASRAGVLAIDNGAVRVSFDEATGAIVGLRNLGTGTELVARAGGPAWTAFVDPSTGDLWSAQARPFASGALAALAVRATPSGAVVDLSFAGAGGADITVTEHVAVNAGEPVIHVTTEAAVGASSGATLVALASPVVPNLAELPGEALTWPWHEGVRFDAPHADVHRIVYPVPASMQWMSVSNASESFYYEVLDADGAYKELRFGGDPDITGGSGARQASAVFYPFAAPGTRYVTPTVDVGVASTGGFYAAAAHYRAWLTTTPPYDRPMTPLARSTMGWLTTANRVGATTRDYCQIPTLLLPPDALASFGVDTAFLIGWHEDGLDTLFPDYDFLGAPGTPCLDAAAMASALDAVHARGERVMLYMNGRIADPASRWFADAGNGPAGAAKQQGGAPYVEVYTGGRSFDVMCPSFAPWQRQLHDKALSLRDLSSPGHGADAIWWDQVSEAGARLCWDRTHGHATPATAFPEGYRHFFEGLRAAFDAEGTPYFFANEGVSDYYARWVDVAALTGSHELGDAPARPCPAGSDDSGDGWPCGGPHDAPEVARYTLPVRILSPVTTAPAGAPDAWAWPFVLGMGFKEPGYPSARNAHAFPRYLRVYAADDSVFLDGTFLDAFGLAIDAPDVRGALIAGSGRDRVAVLVRSLSDAPVTTAVHVDIAALARAGALVAKSAGAARDLEDGAPVPLDGAAPGVSFTVTVQPRDVRAVLVSF